MLNLEWLRSFRSVYKTKSLSKASELLMISQPTVSQHISSLEAKIGQKLFVRKSKGVVETDEGKILNTLISGAIENLEDVEQKIIKSDSKLNNIITIGVSEHLYNSTINQGITTLGEHVHISFGTKQQLKTDVENGKLYCAITTEEVNTFDIVCEHIYDQNMILLSSKDISLDEFDDLYAQDKQKAEHWLTNQTWFSHDSMASHIKLFWMEAFDKKRPSVLPNYIIPNEHETLVQLSKKSGVTIATDSTAKQFLDKNELQKSGAKSFFWRQLHLISNKKKYNESLSQKIIGLVKNR